MIYKTLWCVIPNDMTLRQVSERIHTDDSTLLRVHWTQSLMAFSQLDRAKESIKLMTNGNEKRIIKYIEIIEEAT